jgi:hypothetical protein
VANSVFTIDGNLRENSPVIFPTSLLAAGLETVSVPAYSSSSESAAKVVGKLLVDAKVIK